MIELDGSGLDLGSFSAVAHTRADCELAAGARERVAAARAAVERVVDGEAPVYGINTGFGDLATVRIDPERTSDLQRRLLLSHAAGMGKPLGAEAVRGMLLLRANTLARGYSGVRPAVIELLLALLARDLLPVVPRRGSVGASGDLAPLAHLALPLIGEGEVWVSGVRTAARHALAAAGLEPLTLEAKEGLALINGTQAMTALGALTLDRATALAKLADVACAMTVEATLGSRRAYLPYFHQQRPHPGQLASARASATRCRMPPERVDG